MRCFQPSIRPSFSVAVEAVVVDGAIDVVLDVFLARPDDLDGPVDFLRDAHRFLDIVDFQPAAEAAAEQDDCAR